MDEPRRNDAFDQELRRAFAAGGGAASGPHLDAEVAAAWIDQRLDAPARRVVEAHLADCFDCQAMLATLARISPEAASGGGLVWWRRLRTGWLVPATVAAAAALVIWVAVPQQRAASTPTDQFQVRVDRGPALPEPAPEPAPKVDTAPLPAESEAKVARRAAPEAPALQKKEADTQPAPSLERRERFADAATPAPPPAAPPPSPAAPPPPAAAEAPKLLQETVTVTGESPARADERQNAASTRQQSLGAIAGGAALRASSALVIAAPTGARWRRTGTDFEFATGAGAAYTTVTLPVTAQAINAGASPGGTVCWLAGSGGLVLVSTDGVRFVRVSAPAAVDLVAVTAADARSATVTAADGRRFRTTDAGANWTPQ